MTVITTTVARQHFAELVNRVRYTNKPIAIGRHQHAEVLLIKFPAQTSAQVSDITNLNQYGGAFDWLNTEPDLYSQADLKQAYV